MVKNRRNFLQLIGISTVSAPLAAKAIADENIASLTVLRRSSALASCPPTEDYPTEPGEATEQATRIGRATSYFNLWGKLPDHVEETLKINSKYVHCLDPDIASKRSWSMAVKINEQRQRNYKFAKEHHLQMLKRGGYATAMFKKVTGFDWPYV